MAVMSSVAIVEGNELTQAGLAAGTNGTSVRNAFQHAYWNTLMTIELGAATAEGTATNHETYNIQNTPDEYKMDMRNNYVGRTIGRPLEPRFISAFEMVTQDIAATDVKAAANRQELCVLSPAELDPCWW